MTDTPTPASISAYTTSLATSGVALGLNVNEMIAISGLALAVATFVVNLIYKHLHYKLAAKKESMNGSQVVSG